MRSPLRKLSYAEALDSVATLIDIATDLRDAPAITRAFEQLKSIERRALGPADQAIVHYFRANAWNARRIIRTSAGPR